MKRKMSLAEIVIFLNQNRKFSIQPARFSKNICRLIQTQCILNSKYVLKNVSIFHAFFPQGQQMIEKYREGDKHVRRNDAMAPRLISNLENQQKVELEYRRRKSLIFLRRSVWVLFT